MTHRSATKVVKAPNCPQTWLVSAHYGTFISLQCLPFRIGLERQNLCLKSLWFQARVSSLVFCEQGEISETG